MTKPEPTSVRSLRVATIIYDATVRFCDRFLDKRSRLIDQMVQAARTGRQNVAEGTATSSQTEFRLINLARASLNELLLNYEDILRQRNLRQWTQDDPNAQAVRAIAMRDHYAPSDPSDAQLYSHWLGSTSPGITANAIICLIHQASRLLDLQLQYLERSFDHDGGHTEQLASLFAQCERTSAPKIPSALPAPTLASGIIPGAPSCPKCGKPMALRTARKGVRPGTQFWGCAQYPSCKGVRNVE